MEEIRIHVPKAIQTAYLLAQADFFLNYKNELVRVRRFVILNNEVFLLNFPEGKRAFVIKKDGLNSKIPCRGAPSLTDEDAIIIGDLIESYFYRE